MIIIFVAKGVKVIAVQGEKGHGVLAHSNDKIYGIGSNFHIAGETAPDVISAYRDGEEAPKVQRKYSEVSLCKPSAIPTADSVETALSAGTGTVTPPKRKRDVHDELKFTTAFKPGRCSRCKDGCTGYDGPPRFKRMRQELWPCKCCIKISEEKCGCA